MVIKYSIKELHAIGEMVILRDCSSKIQPAAIDPIQYQLMQLQQLQGQLNTSQFDIQLHIGRETDKSQDLTPAVADFFKNAQRNFYSSAEIDPTNIKLLSEVEAELFGNRYPYQ